MIGNAAVCVSVLNNVGAGGRGGDAIPPPSHYCPPPPRPIQFRILDTRPPPAPLEEVGCVEVLAA